MPAPGAQPSHAEGATSAGAIQTRASFDQIRYANCWEDADVLARALEPLEGARCLSVASAGDNSLSLLARGASSVVAVDLSPAQIALVQLKVAAFRSLPYERLLGFLGVTRSRERHAVYRDLRQTLPQGARAFWDTRRADIESGVIHAGRFERYFRFFRRWVLPLVHGPRVVTALQAERSAGEREVFYQNVWNNRRWRLVFRLFFSRFLLGRLGRDPEFFRFVTTPVAERILVRARHALTALPTHDNPYLRYILNGNWVPLPDYLLPQHFDRIRQSLDRLQLLVGSVEQAAAIAPPGAIDAFNLSDIFEYMDLPAYHALLRSLLPAAAPGARLAYWNMLTPRRRPEALADRIVPLADKAQALHYADRAFFYQDFVLEVVR
jgi:S-adenosylmethionine-diacylglycerol 3-amino-3-carboxypropyl transferase